MNFYNNFQNPYMRPPRRTQPPPIDPVKFQQGAQELSKDTLVELVQKARAQGISDSEIEVGLNYILNLK